MYVPVVVVGAGPAGLAMSAHLGNAGIEHIVLERGEVASSWRNERWDSLRLLTPNWMTALPGRQYEGDDPHGFMTAAQTVAFLDEYRRAIAPPWSSTSLSSRCAVATDGFDVLSDGARWQCDALVAATGGSSEPRVPVVRGDAPQRIQQLTALEYRRPAQIDPDGGVLVVGPRRRACRSPTSWPTPAAR